MSAAQDFARALVLPPQEAVAAIAARDTMTVSWSHMDVLDDAHASQFTISRLTRADLLQAAHDGLLKSVGGDLNRRDWNRDVRGLLKDAGWWGRKESTNPDTGEIVTTKFDNARLKLIFDINTRQAYSAGKWQRAVRNKASHPYIRYRTKKDELVRKTHRQLEGVTLPVVHIFWRFYLPPNDYGCRCDWISVSQAEYDRGYFEWRAPYTYDKDGNVTSIPSVQRLEFKKTAPDVVMTAFRNRSTGEVVQIPAGIGPGFAYNPGEALSRIPAALIKEKLTKLDRNIAAAAVADGLITEKAFAKWMQKPEGEVPLAVLPHAHAQLIGAKTDIAALSAETAVKQLREHPEITHAEYLAAHKVIDDHTNMVQDTAHSLIYIQEVETSAAGGYVLVVKATRTGEGVFVTSMRRLSRNEAHRDGEIARLMRRKK